NSPKHQTLLCSCLALTSLTIRSTTACASDLVISLTKPITRLLRLRSTHYIATQRPRCFLTDPFWYRLLRIDFSLCAFTGTPYWRYRYRSIGSGLLVFLDPRKKPPPAHEFPAPEGDGRN